MDASLKMEDENLGGLIRYYSVRDLVFPNLLASFRAIPVQDSDVTPSLVEVFSTIGGRVNEATELVVPLG